MSLKKQFLKSQRVCKVTFTLPNKATKSGGKVFIVGDFNNWENNATPMRKLKNGNFTISLNLETDKEYQFRYLIDNKFWENDWEADRYVQSPFPDIENSVVII